jgi:hypothetical protein
MGEDEDTEESSDESSDESSILSLTRRLSSDDSGTKLTWSGYPDDPTPDSYSARGIGDHENRLVPSYSAALTKSERMARFGVSGGSTGQEFEFQGLTLRDDDTAPESDRRVDVVPAAVP